LLVKTEKWTQNTFVRANLKSGQVLALEQFERVFHSSSRFSLSGNFHSESILNGSVAAASRSHAESMMTQVLTFE
jgi:hypothetical protein